MWKEFAAKHADKPFARRRPDSDSPPDTGQTYPGSSKLLERDLTKRGRGRMRTASSDERGRRLSTPICARDVVENANDLRASRRPDCHRNATLELRACSTAKSLSFPAAANGAAGALPPHNADSFAARAVMTGDTSTNFCASTSPKFCVAKFT